MQSYKDYEVVITDDTPGNEIKGLVENYKEQFRIKYIKNTNALGTPENWNEAIRNAKGKWIKLMHDDDWFSSKDSLRTFAYAISENPDKSFFFSAYNNVHESTGKNEPVYLNWFRKIIFHNNPFTLIAHNSIGPPSVTLHKNLVEYWYDSRVQWVVDMDFYIRYFKSVKPFYIHEQLINVGINKSQVTTYTFGVAEVQLKENLYLLNKAGSKHLRNIVVYDAWWRLLRNFNIRSLHQLYETGYNEHVPIVLKRTIDFQRILPKNVIKLGIMSKFFMLISYILCFAQNTD